MYSKWFIQYTILLEPFTGNSAAWSLVVQAMDCIKLFGMSQIEPSQPISEGRLF